MWRELKGVDLQGLKSKLATYHALFAVPFDTTARASACLPRQLFLELSARAPEHQLLPTQGTQTQG